MLPAAREVLGQPFGASEACGLTAAVHERTQAQIGEVLGYSQMHVSRLLTHTLATLRDGLLAER
ncbi:sigma factor-like helix-turn-helix DNA-binding protein [Streptomyces fuscigenes]|uniref:sigma factor-like helix-turn-helix DNA-binding protein n=1 Tax=Streptomyces fuscigenes TaxID=1528880 RepID=UPI00355697F6